MYHNTSAIRLGPQTEAIYKNCIKMLLENIGDKNNKYDTIVLSESVCCFVE